jgi:alpha-L-fucosidase
MLVDIVCKGGNLLLNIAPGPQGQWHDEAYQRLKDMGEWMKINSQAIYKTRAIAPYKESNICFTRARTDETLYAIYLAEKDESTLPNQIEINSFQADNNAKINLLGSNKTLKWKKKGNGMVIFIPETLAKNPPSMYAWTFKISKIKS